MKQITGNTSLAGLVGEPVSHSLSPIIQNAAFEEMNLNWAYLAIPCETQNLETVINALRKMDCVGLNITIPYKSKVLKACQGKSPLAKELEAANTLVRNNNNGWDAENTDVEGFLAPIKKQELKLLNAVVIGCGGSARAVVCGLKKLGYKQITIVGRNENNLKEFLINFKLKSTDSTNSTCKTEYINGLLTPQKKEIAEKLTMADLIVNTTPVGMTKERGQTQDGLEIPLGLSMWNSIKTKATLYDLIYTPKPTDWLGWGIRHNLRTIDGLEMLIQQGAASLRLWSGYKDIPTNAMRLAAEKYLRNSNL